MKTILISALCASAMIAAIAQPAVDSVTFKGNSDPSQASFHFQGTIKGSPDDKEPKLMYTVQAHARIEVQPKSITQTCEIKARVFQGKFTELPLILHGDGEVIGVTGEQLRDWSVRVAGPNKRFLVLRPIDRGTNAPAITNFQVTITSTQAVQNLPAALAPLAFSAENAMNFDGFVDVNAHDSVALRISSATGLTPIRIEPSASKDPGSADRRLRFRIAAETYQLVLNASDADDQKITFEKFQLVGDLNDQFATFILSGEAVVKAADGGLLPVLSGDAALTSIPSNAEVKLHQGRYALRFRKPGRYPIELRFNARVSMQDGWKALNFEVVSSALRPLKLNGLKADTQFEFPGAAQPRLEGATFTSFLPSTGSVALRWKEARSEELGKLFYSVQGTARVSVGSGLLRQAHTMEFKVMQGELSQLAFDLTGVGEISRIVGDGILNWKTEPVGPEQRKLIVQLNQAHKDRYTLSIQTQTPLGQFPIEIAPLRIVPADSIRFAGHVLVVNDGAVRLEVTDARGLSQISPELFPKSREMSQPITGSSSQTFAYRFSSGDFSFKIRADHILPEVSVSQLLIYHLGETDSAIDAELELEIREAPLREFVVRVPTDFTVSRLQIAQLGDYSVSPGKDAGWSNLKILFTQPLNGRHILQLRLEKNQNASAGTWELPVLTPENVKALRGYVGVSAETGFRITAAKINGLTEIANAYFPRKVTGLQAAYRLRDETWNATMNIERLTLSVQADATHLFTVTEGITYGSSVINYLIAGSPISILKISVPSDYGNVEFAGREVRNWKKVAEVYEVYLHTPVFGTYTLLATYDRPFNATSNTVSFIGVRPLDAQSEQGTVFVVSEQQVQVKSTQVSANLLTLEPGEILPEHRLLFDAPILAAYQYTARPFEIQLTLQSLALGETVHQVVDRASLTTRVSREGEVVTDGRYFIKSQGHSHLRVTIPSEAQLWEARVNGVKVVPVADKGDTLIPLPGKVDPNAILTVDLKIAGKSAAKDLVRLSAPSIGAPVLLSEWNLSPDAKHRLEFREGSVQPKVRENRTGFAWLWNAVRGHYRND